MAESNRGVRMIKGIIVAIIIFSNGDGITRVEVEIPTMAQCEALTRAIAESVYSADCFTIEESR